MLNYNSLKFEKKKHFWGNTNLRSYHINNKYKKLNKFSNFTYKIYYEIYNIKIIIF